MTRELQSQPSLKKTQAMKDKLAELKRELDWVEESPPGIGPDKFDPASLSRGDRVRVLSLNQIGSVDEVVPISGDQHMVSVLVGTMKVKVPAHDLAPLTNAPSVFGGRGHLKKRLERKKSSGPPPPVVPARELEEFIRTSTNTLDLRGKRVEEALTLVEQFLDGALISGMSPLMVIHGHGTGAIKKAVREYMKSSRYVRSYRSGEMHEGGDGVTVVDVK
ncbi:MAG TPA: Smr/MutS family protein [Candidatus Melainabacteria bacterium]|nr:Smr/MutS family protein [Candidatus Melainabacteria bacterium]